MKKITKLNKIFIAIMIVIILAGIIVTAIYGFNKAIVFKKSTKIEVNIPKGYEKEDIKQISKEVFSDKNVLIQDIEKTNQVVSIRIKNYTEDELNNFKAKIAEKYEIEQDKLSVYEVDVPETRISTIVLPYVLPVSLTTVLSVVYIALKNIKKDMLKKVFTLIVSLIAALALYFSIIAIARIPVTEYTMPIALAVYVATLLITVIGFNKE